MEFLKQAAREQSWGREILVRINLSTQFQPTQTELAEVLQIRQEVQQKTAEYSSSSRTGPSSNHSKPFIYFTQPRVLKSIFPGNENT